MTLQMYQTFVATGLTFLVRGHMFNLICKFQIFLLFRAGGCDFDNRLVWFFLIERHHLIPLYLKCQTCIVL